MLAVQALPLLLAALSSSSGPQWDLSPVHLRGTSTAQMSMYASPPDIAGLKAMIAGMRHHGLGRAFDPVGVPLHELNSTVATILAEANFSYIAFGAGADAQVPNGDFPGTSFTPAALAALRALNTSTVTSVEFGEYGYFFHCLHTQQFVGWWHEVYPKPADFARHQHEMTPAHLSGYRAMPASHAEAYDAFAGYIQQRRNDYQGWMTAMLTGLSHYSEMYAAKWGAGLISMEVGAGIANTQSKIAFARGSSRRFRVPWSLQVSPWMAGSCTTHGPVRNSGGTWVGSAAGHSISFVRRMMLLAWFAGAAMITPENSLNSFFDEPPTASSPGVLSPHGLMGRDVNAFIQSHDRGVPYTPALVVIDEYAGYSSIPCNWSGVSWGIFSQNAQATETQHLNNTLVPIDILPQLFEAQLFPKAGRGLTEATVEAGQLRPTPFGELVDVGLSDTPAEVLGCYKSILLAGGDIDFGRRSNQSTTLAAELAAALALSPDLTVLMQPYHVSALQAVDGFEALNATGRVEVLKDGMQGGRGVAITDERLGQLRDDLMPFNVSANVSVQWQVNKLTQDADGADGWVVGLFNNDGVTKPPNATATLNLSTTSVVEVVPRVALKQGCWEWDPLVGDRQICGPSSAGKPVKTVLAPGASRFLRFV